MSDAGSGFESQINCSNGIRHQVHAGGSVTSRDKDKELGWFMRVGAVAGSSTTGWAVREKLRTKDDSSRASR